MPPDSDTQDARRDSGSDSLAAILQTLAGNPVILYINVSGNLNLTVHANSATISAQNDQRAEPSSENIPHSPVTPRRAGLHPGVEGVTRAVNASPATSMTEPDSQAVPYQVGSQTYLIPGPTSAFNAVRFASQENQSLEDSSSNKRRKYEHD
ncbi:hypothetical protein CVT26_006433 [Gymnopilus dilepis]|uniref:Uncharacterized protein n=1 Tax=Gymnopilus dilepis TaxID=231916 RepID=A0A409Y1U7_9AGAR|nr:hypothetical protein CVT26_006433 [Gymnopilus dilepis]